MRDGAGGDSSNNKFGAPVVPPPATGCQYLLPGQSGPRVPKNLVAPPSWHHPIITLAEAWHWFVISPTPPTTTNKMFPSGLIIKLWPGLGDFATPAW